MATSRGTVSADSDIYRPTFHRPAFTGRHSPPADIPGWVARSAAGSGADERSGAGQGLGLRLRLEGRSPGGAYELGAVGTQLLRRADAEHAKLRWPDGRVGGELRDDVVLVDTDLAAVLAHELVALDWAATGEGRGEGIGRVRRRARARVPCWASGGGRGPIDGVYGFGRRLESIWGFGRGLEWRRVT